MKIVNYGYTRIRVRVDTFGHVGPVDEFLLDDCHSKEVDTKTRSGSIRVAADRPPNFYKLLYDNMLDQWPNAHTMIITRKENPRIVDFTETIAKWRSDAETLTQSGRGDEAEKTAEVIFAFIRGFAAASSALGPFGVMPTGVLTLMAALFDGAQSNLQPPDIGQIESVVRSVVSSEFERNNARLGRSHFDLALRQYVKHCKLIEEVNPSSWVNPGSREKEILGDFAEFVEQLTEYKGVSKFLEYLNLFRQEPNIAKYDIVLFAQSLLFYTDVLRMKVKYDGCEWADHTGNKRYPILSRMKIHGTDVEHFRSEVKLYADGLEQACQVLSDLADKELDRIALKETDEYGAQLRDEVYKCICGTKDISAATDTVKMMKELANKLEEQSAAEEFFGAPYHKPR